MAWIGFSGSGLRAAPPAEEIADILIRGGLLFDGTGAPAFQADIAIKDGRILAVGDLKEIQAERAIYASGYYVSPGFIDLHSHADWGLSDPHLAPAINNLTQGITTVVVGQDGRHAWPVGSSLEEQVEIWRSQGVGNNVIPLAGQGSARLEVMGWDSRAATEEQMAAVAERVHHYLKQGAWGISTGLSYIPGQYSSSDELVEASRPVREVDGVYISHLRNQGIGLVQSIQEMLHIGRETGVRVVATHIKSVGRRNWGNAKAAVAALAEGRRQGISAYADLYPYGVSGNGVDVSLVSWPTLFEEKEIQAWLPPVEIPAADLLDWIYRLNPALAQHYTSGFLKQQPESIIRTISADQLIDRLRSQEIFRQRLRQAWSDQNRRRLVEDSVRQRLERPGGAELFTIEKHPDDGLVGLNLVQAARVRGIDEVETAVQLTLEGAVFSESHIAEEDIITFIQQPWVAACSDGWIPEYGNGRTHPRSYGAFTRRLQRYVFHLGIIRLPFAIQTATGLAAEIIGLKDRGYLRPGNWADIIVFDPRQLRDRATFRNPHQYSQGVVWAFVNGEVVIENGKPNGGRAGQVLLKK